MNELWSAVSVSLHVSLIATLLCAAVGIPLGCAVALTRFHGKQALLAVLNTLLSLPTVVVGLIGYLVLCSRSPFGGLHLLFTPGAIIFGEFILALPIMVVFSHSAFVALDPAARETAQVLGAGKWLTMRMLVSEARFGILAAVAAVFGRLVGEVGIAMMLGGNIANFTRTMTTAIALEASKGEIILGLKLGAILLLIAVGVNLLLRRLQGRMAT
jgi:tungstate transport system permease protein